MLIRVDYEPLHAEAVISASPDLPDTVWNRVRQIALAADPRAVIGARSIQCPWVSALTFVPGLATLRNEFGFRIEANAEAQERLRRFRDERAAIDAVRQQRAEPRIDPNRIDELLAARGFTKRTLTPNQRRDTLALISLSNGANFSVPGAGKTTVALATHLLAATPTDHLLVIAPKTALPAWDEVIDDCISDTASLADRSHLIRLEADTDEITRQLASGHRRFIISYDKLIRERPTILRYLATNPVHVVLDESHRMKAGDASRRGAVLLSLAGLPIRRDILSGTPAPNSVNDLQPQFEFLWPGSDLGRRAVQAARPRDVLQNFYVRTTKGQLGLRPPRRRFERVPMGSAQLMLYASLRSEAIRQLMNIGRDELDVARARRSVMRLLQASCNPVLAIRSMIDGEPEDPPITPAEHLIRAVLDEGDSAKIQRACNLTRELARDGRKTVIWTIFTDTVTRLETLLADLNAVSIHGAIPAGDVNDRSTREGRIAYFHTPECMVLIANPAACSEGISLHRTCHHAIYLDRSYNAAHYLQSIDRIHRLGLPPDVETDITILNSVTPQGLASIDHAVSRRLRNKVHALNSILDDVDLQRIALDEEAADHDVDMDIELDDLVDLFHRLQHEHAPDPEEEDI